jgi:hypothetical protein
MISSTILFTLASLQVGLLFPIFGGTMIFLTEFIMDSAYVDPSQPDSPFSLVVPQSVIRLSVVLDMTVLLSL